MVSPVRVRVPPLLFSRVLHGHGFPRRTLLETVWKVLGQRDGGLRLASWRAGFTPRICPTKNGFASAHIFPSPKRTGTPQAAWLESDPRRRLLRPEERLPLAVAAEGFPALAD